MFLYSDEHNVLDQWWQDGAPPEGKGYISVHVSLSLRQIPRRLVLSFGKRVPEFSALLWDILKYRLHMSGKVLTVWRRGYKPFVSPHDQK